MYVIGTAGHVDHGKSTLVQALTGIDPDRLQEEKARGMTIDLGFAWLKLPSGREVSIVDVPGHERFIKNMLAGVGGIDLALLVIAADEGVMPQTREHLAILDLLGVERGLIVLTKKDLVDEEWLGLITADVQEVLDGTSLANAPLYAISAITREGLSELAHAIDQQLEVTQPREDKGRPRLPIDRVFTIAGFGTVVTGTLIGGTLRVGQEIEVAPQGLRSRIRGLQTHRQKVDVAPPGTRVAANLAGLAVEELARGDVVTSPGWLRPSLTADVHLRLLTDIPVPLQHNANLTFHTLASETAVRVRLLDTPELHPGKQGWAQMRFQHPIALCKDDRFILRSSMGTLGGGVIVDPYPKRHKRFHQATLANLQALEQGSPDDLLMQTLQKGEPLEVAALFKTAAVLLPEAREALDQLLQQGQVVALGQRGVEAATLLVTGGMWRRIVNTAEEALASYHQHYPLRNGMSKEELRSRLRLSSRAGADALERLVSQGALVEQGPSVRLPSHQVSFTTPQASQVSAILRALEKEPYSPALDGQADPEVLNALVDQGKVVRVGEGIIFSAGAFQQMVDKIVAHMKEHQTITVGEVRDMFSTSRKYALAVMEYLDQQRVTRRNGDQRVLR